MRKLHIVRYKDFKVIGKPINNNGKFNMTEHDINIVCTKFVSLKFLPYFHIRI